MAVESATTVDFEDALTEHKLVAILTRLQAIPEPEEFKRRVEDELWAAFVPQEHRDSDSVSLDALPAHKQALLGYLDEEETELPWWLEQFTWEFVYQDRVVLTVPEESLSGIRHLHRGSPSVRKPSFDKGCSIYTALESFNNIRDFLSSNLDTSTDIDQNTELDSHLNWWEQHVNESGESESLQERLIINDNHSNKEEIDWLQTSDEFRSWVNSVVELAPSIDETMTALMLANCGIEKRYIARVVPVAETLDRILSSASWNKDRKLMNAFAGVLLWEQALDLSIGDSSYEELTALEKSLYDGWLSEVEDRLDSDELITVVEHAKINSTVSDNFEERPQYILLLPIKKRRSKYSFASTKIKHNGYKKGKGKTLSAIHDVLLGEELDERED